MRRLRTRLHLEHLNDRIVPVTGVLRNALGHIVIEGTAGDDSANVSVSGSNFIVDLNGTSYTFAAPRVTGFVFKGLAGNDSFTNNSIRPSLGYGGSGDDLMVGGSSTDKFFGGDGNDDLSGNNGNDVLYGELGDDRLTGGSGNDGLSGSSGNDDLNGDSGNDILRGGHGSDDLDGGHGNDDLNGEDGDDRLVGNLGSDIVRGGRGTNRSVRDSIDRLDDTRIAEGFQLRDGLAKVEGTITAIDGSNVTIRTVGGVDVPFIVSATTILEINGVHVGLSAFSVGMPGEARFDPSTRSAFKLESGEDPDDNGGGGGGQTGESRAEGIISALTDNSVSIRLQSGQIVTVLVNNNTIIERNDLHVPLSAFRIGDRGEARFDASSLLARKVEAVGT